MRNTRQRSTTIRSVGQKDVRCGAPGVARRRIRLSHPACPCSVPDDDIPLMIGGVVEEQFDPETAELLLQF